MREALRSGVVDGAEFSQPRYRSAAPSPLERMLETAPPGRGFAEETLSRPDAPSGDARPHWNLWATDDASQVVHVMRGGRRYTITLDISPYLYASRSGIAGTSQLEESVKRALQEDVRALYLKVRPIELGSALRRASSIEPELKVALDPFRQASLPDERAQAQELIARVRSLPELASRLSAGSVSIPVDAMAERGCAQMAFAIFDASGTRPIDHIVYSLPVVEDSLAPVSEATCPLPRVQGGFSSLAAGMPLATGNVDATLHMFQFDAHGRVQTTAIYIDTAKYAAAAPDLPLAQRGVYTWNLQSDPLHYIGKELQARINEARELNDYSGVASELSDKLFPHRANEPDTAGAPAALKSLRTLVTAGRKASLLARAMAKDGRPVYAPLGLLASLAEGAGRLQVFYPLPREDYDLTSCIANWTLGYPEELEGHFPTSRLELAPKELFPGRMRRIATRQELVTYLDPPQASDEAGAGEAFLLLAHHGEGYFWFKGSGRTGDRIPIERNNRRFPRGSVAFLNVCSAANPTNNNQEVMERFNRNGVDAMVVSPFPVDSVYGNALSLAAIRVVREAYEAGQTPSLAEIFEQAAERTKTLLPDESLDLRNREFLLLGNPNLRLCRR